jgi:hypothetical protein
MPRTLVFTLLLAVVAFFMAFGIGTEISTGSDPAAPPTPGLPPTMTRSQIDTAFTPGPPWDGKGTGNLSQTDAENFAPYPLLWVGPNFAGYNLQRIARVQYDAPPGATPPHMDVVSFTYGDCVISPGAEACQVPFQVMIFDVCYVTPERIAPDVKQGPPTAVRGGALMQKFTDGHVALWTSTVFVDIDGAREDLPQTALARLEGVGSRLGIRPGGALAAPDFSRCK